MYREEDLDEYEGIAEEDATLSEDRLPAGKEGTVNTEPVSTSWQPLQFWRWIFSLFCDAWVTAKRWFYPVDYQVSSHGMARTKL